MYPIKENSVIHFNTALNLFGLLLKKVYDRGTNGVMTQKEVKCTPNNQCKCTVSNEKWGMLLCEIKKFPWNENAIIPIWKYD